MPFIDDEDDDSNQGIGGLPRELVATAGIRRLFQETFCVGREHPHRRPAMGFWAMELAKAFDHSFDCAQCKMSYFADDNKQCPYCGLPRPAFIRVRTPNWEILIPGCSEEFKLPHRLGNPFSFEHNDETEYEVAPRFAAKSVFPVRGTKALPDKVIFEFVDAEK
jgi:ribosomal protein L37E